MKAAAALVTNVVPDMLAAQVGIVSGDVIESVNGQRVDTHTLPLALKQYIGKTFLLVVDRNGTKESIEITCPDDSCVL